MGSLTAVAIGSIDHVYKTPQGISVVPEESNGEDMYKEGTIGWYQKKLNERVKVKYTRISHTMCAWKEVSS